MARIGGILLSAQPLFKEAYYSSLTKNHVLATRTKALATKIHDYNNDHLNEIIGKGIHLFFKRCTAHNFPANEDPASLISEPVCEYLVTYPKTSMAYRKTLEKWALNFLRFKKNLFPRYKTLDELYAFTRRPR